MASADQVNMEVKHALPSTRPDVQHGSVTILHAMLVRQFRRNDMAITNQLRILLCGFLQPANMLLGDDEDVHRTLRPDIVECESAIIFVDLFRGCFAPDHAAEQTSGFKVGHRHTVSSFCFPVSRSF